MKPSDNDAFGDGHGWRLPDKRLKIKIREHKFDYDLTKMPTHDRPFLGLYNVRDDNARGAPCTGTFEPRIVIRAKEHRGLRLTSFENHHYLEDPIAWAELPSWEE